MRITLAVECFFFSSFVAFLRTTFGCVFVVVSSYSINVNELRNNTNKSLTTAINLRHLSMLEYIAKNKIKYKLSFQKVLVASANVTVVCCLFAFYVEIIVKLHLFCYSSTRHNFHKMENTIENLSFLL